MSRLRSQSSRMFRGINTVVMFLLGPIGLNLQGAEILEVKGRSTGVPRRVPVNPVMVGSTRYLMSPRGETGWVKNIRASHEASLRHGRRSEVFGVREVPDEEKIPVLRAYLDRWHWQVGSIMGVEKNADDATLREIAPRHPVFVILPNDRRAGASDQAGA